MEKSKLKCLFSPLTFYHIYLYCKNANFKIITVIVDHPKDIFIFCCAQKHAWMNLSKSGVASPWDADKSLCVHNSGTMKLDRIRHLPKKLLTSASNANCNWQLHQLLFYLALSFAILRTSSCRWCHFTNFPVIFDVVWGINNVRAIKRFGGYLDKQWGYGVSHLLTPPEFMYSALK